MSTPRLHGYRYAWLERTLLRRLFVILVAAPALAYVLVRGTGEALALWAHSMVAGWYGITTPQVGPRSFVTPFANVVARSRTRHT